MKNLQSIYWFNLNLLIRCTRHTFFASWGQVFLPGQKIKHSSQKLNKNICCCQNRIGSYSAICSKAMANFSWQPIFGLKELKKNDIDKKFQVIFQTGDPLLFYEDNQIHEGLFLCSSLAKELTPKQIFAEILSTEEEVTAFCISQKIETRNQHIYQ